MRRLRTPAFVLALALGILVFARAPVASEPAATTRDARALSLEFQEVGLAVGPAVALIRAEGRAESSRGGSRRRTARGSGVIISSEGIVVTNHHVVQGAERIRVQLADERELDARLIGLDPDTDLAVLRLPEGTYPAAALAEGGPPPVGTWVLAFGNPYGLGHSMTQGIVSATGRRGLDIATYEDFLQTDAAINAGNSGGPLVDLSGRVVGINTARGTPFEGSVGLGFAIPAYLVREVVRQLVAEGRVRRGWLGIRFRAVPAPRELAAQGRSGALAVAEVLAEGPAARAGLTTEDLILALDGVAVTSEHELMLAIASLAPGTQAELELWRAGRRERLAISLGEREPGAR